MVAKKGEGQFTAEDMPGSTGVDIYTSESDFGTEAAAFTNTQRRRPVGFMDRHPSGTIGTVFVRKSFRRRGVADRMYEAAGRPPHSNELTAMGAAWSKKVGGEQHEERGERRIKAEPLQEGPHERLVLPVVANEIRETGQLKSRGRSFRGS